VQSTFDLTFSLTVAQSFFYTGVAPHPVPEASESMNTAEDPILTKQHLTEYKELGVVHSIPILSTEEVAYYRAEAERTCRAIGDGVARLDALHLFFRWAWDLSTHPRLLDCLEHILGPDIVLKSTRLFYKHARSASYVGWHQDGVTERLNDGRAPAIWLGLTAATAENGCLRVVPGSHRLGLLEHVARPIRDTVTDVHNMAHKRLRSRAREAELSGKVATVPTEANLPLDLVMGPGEMSIHHPAILHGSNANRSTEPRIGLSASYSSPDLYDGTTVVWARGNGTRHQYQFRFIEQPPTATFEEAVAAYFASDFQILFAQA
jgi:ectoine hydroxylase-related dioxygenase (phytanoyl-CoA dioxygenase family)